MVTTSTATVSSTATITNNGNMLLYNNNNPTVAVTNSVGVGGSNCNSSTLEQYRLQLYNYALNMERLRGPPYTAAAMAAAAAYASSTTVATTSGSGQTHHGNNYTTPQAPPPPSSYICATATGLIAASSHMSGPSAAMAQCPTSNRLALASMSLFPQRIFQPEEPKPQHSYIGLIAMAILSSAETKLVLSDIYQYILDNYPYFRTRGPGWRNSIRHNLSLNDCFIKSGRSANGKGHYWAIHPANMEDFRKGDFRRRKAQRKVRKHMGLAVDDNGTDSPSPPPAMDLTSPSPPSSFQQHCASVMGGTITPLATAAQQLAAHSFGWRLTQHHRQQTAQHTTGSQSGASYMGQIFTYRPQQHYVAAAAAAAALCNGGSTQQHQQHLIATTNHHQQHQIENSFQNHKNSTTYMSSPHDKSEQRQSSSLSSTSVNVINEIFSQKRKRQFDVASLLAPDNSHKREHHPYLRHAKPESPQLRPSNCRDNVVDDEVENPSANDLDIEDIDVVVASEDEDIEADYEHDNEDEEEDEEEVDDEDSNCNSQRSQDEEELDYTRNFDKVQHPKSLKNHCEDESRIRVQEYEPLEEEEDDDVDDQNNDQIQHLTKKNNNNNENYCDNNKDMCIFKQNHPVSAYDLFGSSQNHSQSQPPPLQLSPAPQATRASTITPSPPPPIVTQILEASDHHHHHSYNQLPLNDAHHLFGRYYGTYMAAAAAARINSSIPTNIVSNTD